MIMKIKEGTSSPYMPSSIHERTYHRSSTKEVFHAKWAHDKAKCSSSGNSNSRTSIHLLKLHHLFILRQSEKILFAASCQKTNSGLGKNNCMSCHNTGGNSSEDKVLGRRDPITGTEQIGHIIAIVQNCQAGLGISTELTSFCQPVYHRSNVLDGMRVDSRDIPKNREETTSLQSL